MSDINTFVTTRYCGLVIRFIGGLLIGISLLLFDLRLAQLQQSLGCNDVTVDGGDGHHQDDPSSSSSSSSWAAKMTTVIPSRSEEKTWNNNNNNDDDVDVDIVPTDHLPWEDDQVYNVQVNPDLKVGICCIIKDAEGYLDEWIDYNFAIGFHAIYIYDNTQRNDYKQWGQQQQQQENGRNIHVIPFPEQNHNLTQHHAYDACVRRFRKSSNYIAFLDDDEFLVLKKHRHVSDLLHEYLVPYQKEGSGALTISWRRFGSSNHTMYSTIPTLRRFQYREYKTHIRVKSIVRSADFVEMQSAHVAILKHNKTNRDTTQQGGNYDWTRPYPGYNKNRPNDVAVIHHYRYKSEKEWWYKECIRETVMGKDVNWKACGEPAMIGTVFDDAAWKILRSRVPKYRVFDDWQDRS